MRALCGLGLGNKRALNQPTHKQVLLSSMKGGRGREGKRETERKGVREFLTDSWAWDQGEGCAPQSSQIFQTYARSQRWFSTLQSYQLYTG